MSLVTNAMSDELAYFSSKVWELTTEAAARQRPNATVVGGRWILSNKGDNLNPKVRARYVATEVNKEADLAFYAATPPLEAIRLLLSKFAHTRTGMARN